MCTFEKKVDHFQRTLESLLANKLHRGEADWARVMRVTSDVYVRHKHSTHEEQAGVMPQTHVGYIAA